MKRRNLLTLLFASVGMLVLIFDSRTAVAGIQSGIDICLRTLIPSLFPFFVVSGFITSSMVGQPVGILRFLGKICRIPEGSESLLAVGFLGGYPVGAKNVWDTYSKKQLTNEDARRMVVFCNNAGPSFLFGILGPLFPDKRCVWALWLVQIIGAILTGVLLPGGSRERRVSQEQKQISFSDILNRSLASMAAVCGWVTLFRMVLEFLDRWIFWLFPVPLQVLLTGMLELSNGCISLQQTEDVALRFYLASVMLSIGGLCILMQTKSVFPDLDIRQYLGGKLLQCTISVLLSAAAIPVLSEKVPFSFFLIPAAISITLITAISRKRKKEVAIP